MTSTGPEGAPDAPEAAADDAADDELPPQDPRWLYLPFATPCLGYFLLEEVQRIGPRGFQLDDRALWALSLLAGLALWAAAVKLALAYKRVMGYQGWVIAAFAAAWLVCLPGWPYAAGRYLNRRLDHGAAAPLTARVAAKPWQPGGRRRNDYYFLTLSLSDGRSFDLPVPLTLWNDAAVGQAMVLRVSPGAFGWPWVLDATLAPPAAPASDAPR